MNQARFLMRRRYGLQGTLMVAMCSWLSMAQPALGQEESRERSARMPGQILQPSGELIQTNASEAASRQAYFGDLHVHTKWSFDAFAFGTIATPHDAYRYALGESIPHPSGYNVKLRAPLDFYAVTDHAGYLGALNVAADLQTEFAQLEFNAPLHNLNAPENLNNQTIGLRGKTFSGYLGKALRALASGEYEPKVLTDASRTAWLDIIEAAERYNDPGTFTTFVAYEYTATSLNGGNLHRNVIFRNAQRLPEVPFSSLHSRNPEDLWDWLDTLRVEGVEALAIPHNSNASNGQMFPLVDWAGDPMDADYAAQRIRNEPLVEITQIKGTSETHPLLSARDEWAGFEIMPFLIGQTTQGEIAGSYVREALLNGLRFHQAGQPNPYEFGLVGSSDTHTGAASIEEDNYFSKVGLMDGEPALRGSVPLNKTMERLIADAGRQQIEETEQGMFTKGAYETWGASGLTGVWAEENTREAIYAAFRRKETFATSGPRIQIRLFAAVGEKTQEFKSDDALEAAYRHGVPMGSRLLVDTKEQETALLVWAMRDPASAPLQRLQIVKGWLQDGELREQVFDVACSGGDEIDPKTHRCPDNGASVDLTTCGYGQDAGANELRAVWRDPSNGAGNDGSVFYYARAIENPTCRWSTWDAIRAGTLPREGIPKTLQERAWSSPIWLSYTSEE